jgi:predicted nucleotidyltransferase
MRAVGVICEFNPFHNGHAYLLSRMREVAGEDGCVICLMSGRFVQRGEPAMADPYLRAKTALAGGADLVLELPFPYSAGSAEFFASAGVEILSRLGVDRIAFGSESGDISLLETAAHGVEKSAFKETYATLCRGGMGTTAAYAQALRDVCPATLPEGFPSSNDLLGIAYLSALRREQARGGSAPTPLVVTRMGAGYREDILTEGAYPSATALRAVIREAACDPVALEAILGGTMPDESLSVLLAGIGRGDAPTDGGRLLSFFHALYRLQSPATLEGYAEWGGGLAWHICRHAKHTTNGEDFFKSLRTKQYTDARLRRALLFGALGVTDQDLRMSPTYTTLLAANRRGCTFLKEWRKANKDASDGFEVVTKPADAPEGQQRFLAERADALFTLCYPVPREAGEMYRVYPHIHP